MTLTQYLMLELGLLMAYSVITICALSTTPSSNIDWETWKTIHGKKYNSKTLKEFAELFNTYERKAVPVNNQTREPMKARHFYRIPESVDWRTAGYVTPPKNQGQCHSCWAFSATGVLEGQLFKKTGKLITLSEQNLIDCSRSHGAFGCNGGWSLNAFEYVYENGGIEAESTYAYTAKEGKSCKYNTSKSVVSVSSYKTLPYGDEEALTRAVAEIGPIAVVIDAGLESWRFYSSGVYYDPRCSTNTFNHAVLVVGYGIQSGMKYYIVKNSWGQHWGQSGYILMARGRNNNCGIAGFPIYALV